MTNSDNYAEFMYLDYVNNFLSVDKFAEYYELSGSQAQAIIEQGRTINNKR